MINLLQKKHTRGFLPNKFCIFTPQ